MSTVVDSMSRAAAPARVRPLRGGRPHLPVVGVLVAYVVSAVLIPSGTPVPVSDDWVYYRSVELLVRDHVFRILDLTVTTLVFQVAWGALFAEVFGLSFAVLRASTVVLVAASALALYGICRRLGAGPALAALGTAAYLFDPLAYSLSFTFMSDPVFSALLVFAAYGYLRGLSAPRWLVVGSGFAALAFLTRQQGALLPPAVLAFLVLSRRLPLRPVAAAVRPVLAVAGLPALALFGYYGWLYSTHVPEYQRHFLDAVRNAGAGGMAVQAGRLGFVELMYAGFFALPLCLAAVPGLRVRLSGAGRWLFGGWLVVIAAGLVAWRSGPWFPYVPHFVNAWGLGPTDIAKGRPALVSTVPGLVIVTGLVALLSCCVAALLAAGLSRPSGRAADGPGSDDRAGAGLLTALLVGQVVGVLPPSATFRNWHVAGRLAPSLDRYLLPLLPLVLALLVWALVGRRVSQWIGWLAVAAVGVFSAVGTRDSFVFQRTAWQLAQRAVTAGVPLADLDGGMEWDGLHLWERSWAEHATPKSWQFAWTRQFAPIDTETYVVAGSDNELRGYVVVWRQPYSAWLQSRPVAMYLLRRADAPWPPR